MKDSENIKRVLLDYCHAFVDQRITNAHLAINAAQEAANAEEKSSAGNKYETGRAMAQLERDKAAQQLNEAMALRHSLSIINIKGTADRVTSGSLVLTDKNNFFVAISLGKLTIAQTDYFVIAPATPVGKLLMGAKAGSRFLFNHQQHTIQEIV